MIVGTLENFKWMAQETYIEVDKRLDLFSWKTWKSVYKLCGMIWLHNTKLN